MNHAHPLPLWLPWAIGYALLLGAVVAGTFKTRDWAFEQLAADWEEWRDDVRQQQVQPSPVQRRVPQSSEPPALVMMRDHFVVSLFAAVVFSTMLYWVSAWFVIGITTDRNRTANGFHNTH